MASTPDIKFLVAARFPSYSAGLGDVVALVAEFPHKTKKKDG